ncbi:MAG: hypothetical protein H6732_03315 [Alphaproteobacteria bacterium]|nr:hypothetical protein [Alphaproteobacteria bacterium]
MPRPRITYLYRPGRTLPLARRDRLVAELREVAETCFDELPRYQVIAGDPEALDHAVLTVARDADGRVLGFCAARLLPVEGVGEVFHLGLTCVHPDARGTGLTHQLLSQVIGRYLLLHRPLRGAWFSNAASVLSSLGNVALHFEDVHPSPFRQVPPSSTHLRIARAIAAHHRARLHLRPDTPFCDRRFVFTRGNLGTPFAKARDEAAYHHRDPALTRWYGELADLDAGDAVVQVGRVSLGGFGRHVARRLGLSLPGVRHLFPARPVLPVHRALGGA